MCAANRRPLRNPVIGFAPPASESFSGREPARASDGAAEPSCCGSGKGDSAECLELLSRFGIRRLTNVKAGRISGGELQRAGICRALINRPRLLLLDEPTASLDDTATDEVASTIRMLKERGVAILLASHDPRLDGLESQSLRLEAGKAVMS